MAIYRFHFVQDVVNTEKGLCVPRVQMAVAGVSVTKAANEDRGPRSYRQDATGTEGVAVLGHENQHRASVTQACLLDL